PLRLGVAAVLAAVGAISQAATAMAGAPRIPMDRPTTATPTVAAHRTQPDKARPTIAPTAPARHTTMVEVRLIRTPTGVKLRVNTGKGRPTLMPMAGPLPVPMVRARIT